MKEVLLLKHAVGGRTFYHTGQQPLPYQVTPAGPGWTITLDAPLDADMQELLQWKQELNVFVFQEFDDHTTKKIWFYVDGDQVSYDVGTGQLTIHAASRIEYVPTEFEYS